MTLISGLGLLVPDHYGLVVLSAKLLVVLRWFAIGCIAAYAAKSKSLSAWVILGMAAGVECGYDWPTVADKCQFLMVIFLRLIKTLLAPLLFATLVVGIAGHANLKKVGRIGVKALIYFEIVSTLALAIGFLAIGITRAGVGVRVPPTVSAEILEVHPHSAADLITNIFPENIAKSIADGQILQVVAFSILFGLALAMVPEPKRGALVTFAESLSETMFKFANLVMFFAPVGVFGAMAYTVGRMGVGILFPLLRVVITMYAAMGVLILLVFVPIAIAVGVPLRRFVKAVAKPVTIAFATASSEAALPRALQEMEALGVTREVAAFVLPLGYTFNLDGSSLYQSLAVMFVAQAAGIHLGFSQQALIFLTLLITSKGTGGVARASLVIVLGTVASFHLPTEPIFLLFGIDQLMDMARTAVNVLGNCLATLVIARWEGETVPFLV